MEVAEEAKKKAEGYPLTISRSAKEHTPLPAASKSPVPCSNAEQSAKDGAEDHVTSKAPSPKGRSRFYFESDTLALKNNPE